MDTLNEKKISFTPSHQSIMLMQQALREYRETGDTTVICPKCGKKPILTREGNRRSLSCECGYLFMAEIFF